MTFRDIKGAPLHPELVSRGYVSLSLWPSLRQSWEGLLPVVPHPPQLCVASGWALGGCASGSLHPRDLCSDDGGVCLH